MASIISRTAAASVLVALAGSATATAGVALVSSSATIVHASNFGSTPATRSATFVPMDFASPGVANPPVTGPMSLPLGALVNGATNTTAKAGIGTVTSSSFIGLVLASGTSLTQKGNLNPAAATASTLTISFSATWQVVGSFGMGVQAGATLTAAGSLPANPPPGPNVPSPTAFFRAGVSAAFEYQLPAGGGFQNFRAPVSNPNFLYTNYQGGFSLTSNDLSFCLPGEFGNGTLLRLSGTFTYSLHNDGQEAEMRLDGPGNTSSTYDIVTPAPSAAGLLTLAGLVAARRRR